MAERALFLDLDGVLADFDRGVQTVTGKLPHELDVKTMWMRLARFKDFYDSLHLMPDGRQLWEFCKPHRPTILTGLPMGNWAEGQKRRWVARELGPEVPVIACRSKEKHKYAHDGAVLVDDRESLMAAWQAAGGVFVLHRDAESSIAELRALGFGQT